MTLHDDASDVRGRSSAVSGWVVDHGSFAGRGWAHRFLHLEGGCCVVEVAKAQRRATVFANFNGKRRERFPDFRVARNGTAQRFGRGASFQGGTGMMVGQAPPYLLKIR